jgi:HSP20 family molecular chaperone IbpA
MPPPRKKFQPPPMVRPNKVSKMKVPLNVVQNDVDGVLSLEIDIPGCTSADLALEMHDNVLRVLGKRGGVPFEERVKIDDKRYDVSTIDAVLQDGLLHVVFDAVAPVQPVVVTVTVVDANVSGSV